MNRRMLSKEDEAAEETEVRREDQDKINKFSRLHQHQQTLEDELKAKQASISNCQRIWPKLTSAAQKDKEDTEDVSTQLEELELLGDDEDTKVQYKIGDSFVALPLAEVQEMLSSSAERIDKDVSKLEERLSTIRDEMQELKVALYARFGRSINLET